MQLNTDDGELDETTTVKIQLEKRQVVRLKSEKILTGETLSSITAEALARYFEAQDTDTEEDE